MDDNSIVSKSLGVAAILGIGAFIRYMYKKNEVELKPGQYVKVEGKVISNQVILLHCNILSEFKQNQKGNLLRASNLQS